MKKTLVLAVVGLVVRLFAAGDPLLEGFRAPPHAAKPHVWWHWMNGNVSKAGITADLEAMAKAGIGGAQIFDVSDGIPAGRVAFNSDLWFEMLKHANEEAKRLGIELCLANCSGWSSSGGPWVKPEDAEKDVVFAETVVKGGASFSGKLPCAANPHGFYRDLKVLAFPRSAAERIDPKAYGAKTEIKGDVATISFAQPFPLSGVTVSLEGGGRHPTSKVAVEVDSGAGFTSVVTNFQVYPTRYGFTDERLFVPVVAKNARGVRVTCKSTSGVKLTTAIPEARGRIVEEGAKTFVIRSRIVGHANPVASELTIDPKRIRDLTSALGADGTFHWTAPADVAEWVIVRFGYAANGTRNRPPTPGGDGLEVDKFSKTALGRFFTEGYVDKALRILGPVDPRGGVNALIVDSFEVKSQNWTDGFEQIFAARKHYDLTKFLPVFTGRIVGSTDETDAFLADFRSVASDLFIENYAAEFHHLCQARGLQFYLEGYGSAPCDDLRYERHCDVPMGEYWAKTNLRTGNCRFAGSVAHVWGHRFVAAESFTTAENGRWTRDPFAYKAQGDRAFCAGINRIIYHRWAHQPWTNPANAPGMTMGPHGSHFERTQTWWNDAAAAWLTYQARCQWMLQQGVAASALLVVAPKGTPSCGLDLSRWHEYESVSGDRFGRGIQWDLCDEEALAASKVVNGKTVTPSGAAYAQVMHLSRDKAPRIKPDFDCADEAVYRDLGWIHRRTAAGDDIYFVALPNAEEKTFEVSFRGTGRRPEIWDPETGTVVEPIAWRTDKGRTFVTFTFKPSGAAFVVFRASPTSSLEQVPKPSSVSKTIHVEGPWQVQFLNGRGAPATPVDFPELQPWNEHTNPGIRFYSGSAVYSKTIHLTDDLFKHSNLETFKQSSSENRILLDLGDVKNVAVVTVNGTNYPVLWRPPFRLNITEAVKQAIISNLKTMSLSIRVTNLWPNRLIGDDALPCDAEYRAQNDPVDARNLKGGIVAIPERLWREEPSPIGRHTFTTWRHWTKDDKLFPSGLLGPVKLVVREPTIELPGEKQTVAPIPCAPFPDRISAYVWRNWFLVPHDRLAATVGAKEELDLVRRDSRIGYESSNHYFFVPQDFREKILSCRLGGCDESFSPAFFWWWNSKLEVSELCAQVDDFYEQGVRTLCIHPFPQGFRPGRFPCDMTPDYLTDDYLDIYAKVTDYAARKGMTCWFYDEGGRPSGGACGQVVASDPECFAIRWMTLDKTGRPKVISAKYNPAFQSSNPSVIEPGATEKFLELTHERVKTRIGRHFGKAVPWVFTDEPSAPHGLANLGWSTDFEREFQARKGYDILPYVPALIRSQTRGPIPEDVKKVRIDYHEVMSQLFLERFVRPNRDWCRQNGLLYGGHFDGDDDMRCNLTHGHYHLLRFLREMDLPGVDCIWRQIHPDVDYTPLPRFASSAAHQTGAKRVLSETFAIYGETLSPDIMKRTVDFEMVRGVNQFVFAFVCQSTKKNFMSIGDPHFGKSDPKNAFMRPFNEYVRDTCARLAQGTNPVRVAVYYDVRAVWAGGHDVNEEGETASRAQIQVAKGLDARQVDFDFIDDDLIEAGRIPYDVLVFPTNRHLTEKGKSALASFRAHGGRTLGPDELDLVPRTCQVKGAGATSIRVTKRLVADGATDYFIVNEDDRALRVTVAFPEGPEITREFDPYGSEFVRINPNGTAEVKPSTKPVVSRQNLDRGWTIRRTWSVRPGKTDFEYATYPDEPAVPCELGDWGPVLGTNFSGHAIYRVEFTSRAAEAVLDLGKVGLCADARLNGQQLTPKFFGPFRWPVTLEAGTNVLEVTVGNSLAPALIPELPRIGREFPPVSAYAERERAFYAKDGLASGLIGPVVLNITR